MLILNINSLTIVLTFEASLSWCLTYKNITFKHKHKTCIPWFLGCFDLTKKENYVWSVPFLFFSLVLVYGLLRNVWFCDCVGISFIE